MITIDQLDQVATLLLKEAQEVSSDYSLVENVRKMLGSRITQDASQFLNSRAVSSIPVRVRYQKPNASFNIDATGKDAAAVNQELKSLLDKKYGPTLSRMLSRLSEPAFEFGLLTVE